MSVASERMVVLGQVGLGHWGPNLLRNFTDLSGCRVKTCCDLLPAALERAQKRHPEVRATLNYEDILCDDDIDAIVISGPTPTHYELSMAALRHDKHVFVEKPMASRPAEAEEMIALAARRNRVLMVGHLLKYHPAVAAMKRYVEEDELGDIFYIYSQRLNLGVVRQHENALWSLAPHDISVMLHLLDEDPIAVSAQGMDHLQAGIEDTVLVSLRFPGKQMAYCQVSWLDPHKVRRITVVGSRKMAVFDDVESVEKLRIYDKGVNNSPEYESYGDSLSVRFGDVYIPRVDMREPLRLECQHFVECLCDGQRPLSDGKDGLRVLRVLDAAQHSLKLGGQPVPYQKEK